MKIAFLSENNFKGTVPRTFENARTEFAWMLALGAKHHPIQEFKKVKLSPLAKRRAKSAFTLGCANRLSKRLKEKYLSIVPEYQPIANPDGLPMLYKSEQKALTDWLAKQGVTLTNSKSRMSIRDRMAYANGQSKGNGIGIDTQVNDKTKARLLT